MKLAHLPGQFQIWALFSHIQRGHNFTKSVLSPPPLLVFWVSEVSVLVIMTSWNAKCKSTFFIVILLRFQVNTFPKASGFKMTARSSESPSCAAPEVVWVCLPTCLTDGFVCSLIFRLQHTCHVVTLGPIGALHCYLYDLLHQNSFMLLVSH